MPQSACGGQRMTVRRQFFSFHRTPGACLCNKHSYLRGHLPRHSFHPFYKIKVRSECLYLSYSIARLLSRSNGYFEVTAACVGLMKAILLELCMVFWVCGGFMSSYGPHIEPCWFCSFKKHTRCSSGDEHSTSMREAPGSISNTIKTKTCHSHQNQPPSQKASINLTPSPYMKRNPTRKYITHRLKSWLPTILGALSWTSSWTLPSSGLSNYRVWNHSLKMWRF